MNRSDMPQALIAWMQALTDIQKLEVCLLISTGKEDLNRLNGTALLTLIAEYEWVRAVLEDRATNLLTHITRRLSDE